MTIDSVALRDFRADAVLPSPSVQATNLIRYIGNEVSRSGDSLISLNREIVAIVGSSNLHFLALLIRELKGKGLLLGHMEPSRTQGMIAANVNLTLDGWDRYELERKGLVADRYAFLAMKFNQPELESLVKHTIKPALKGRLSYELLDSRDASKAGVIDNLMRTQIRDAAFVLVDLTHDNPGAYWEAGYAEGLGKPVIYICERSKFDATKSHFDTNHCTTVPWSSDELDSFVDQLVATIRRSMDF